MDLAYTDVTITLIPQDRDMLGFAHKVSFPVIAFGNGAKTYPANGVPMPAIGAFGMNKVVKFFTVMQSPGNGFHYKYDKVRNTIRIYQSPAVSGGTVSAVSGGTPAGTLNAPAFTGTPATPTGTVDAGTHVFSGVEAAPAGSVAAPAFSGSALATHTHAISAEAAAGALVELGNVAVAAVTDLIAMVVGN